MVLGFGRGRRPSASSQYDTLFEVKPPDDVVAAPAAADPATAPITHSLPAAAHPPGGGSSACSWLLGGDSFSSVARARGEGRVADATHVSDPSVLDEKEEEIAASPTASEVTATEISSVLNEDEEEGVHDAPATSSSSDAIPPRIADVSVHSSDDDVTSRFALPQSPGGMSSERMSVRSGSSGENRRRRKKPPTSLPPTAISAEGLPMTARPRRQSDFDAPQTWCTAPVSTPLPHGTRVSEAHAFDSRRRAEWVEESGLSI